jgi:hypothetical protein
MLSTGFVAGCSFAEDSDDVLHDTSARGNSGTVSNATWSAAGKFDDVLSFTGSLGSWLTVPNSSLLDLTTGIILEGWVAPSSLSSPDAGWAAALSKEHQKCSNGVAYARYAAQGTGPAGHVLARGTDCGAGGHSVPPLNAWTFLSATYDGTTLRMYVNGSRVGSTAIKGSIVRSGATSSLERRILIRPDRSRLLRGEEARAEPASPRGPAAPGPGDAVDE